MRERQGRREPTRRRARAESLWFRLVGNLPPAAPGADTGIRLRPAWVAELLRLLPAGVGERVLAGPQWAELVAAVAEAARQTGLSEAQLLNQVVESANLDPAVGGADGEAAATTMMWRIEQLLQPPEHDDPPPDYDDPAEALPDNDQQVDLGPLAEWPIPNTEAETVETDPAADNAEADESGETTPRGRLVEVNEAAASWWAGALP